MMENVEIHVSTDCIGNVGAIVEEVLKIEEAHSVNCVLRVEVFKASDLLNCLCEPCGPSDS